MKYRIQMDREINKIIRQNTPHQRGAYRRPLSILHRNYKPDDYHYIITEIPTRVWTNPTIYESITTNRTTKQEMEHKRCRDMMGLMNDKQEAPTFHPGHIKELRKLTKTIQEQHYHNKE